jgi:hypothetical protein
LYPPAGFAEIECGNQTKHRSNLPLEALRPHHIIKFNTFFIPPGLSPILLYINYYLDIITFNAFNTHPLSHSYHLKLERAATNINNRSAFPCGVRRGAFEIV